MSFNPSRLTLGGVTVATYAAVVFAGLGLTIAPSAASEATLFPFFSRPYPYGYTRAARDPDADCWQYRRIDTFLSSRVERVWVCNDRVIARY